MWNVSTPCHILLLLSRKLFQSWYVWKPHDKSISSNGWYISATVRKLAHNFIVGTRLETFRHFLFLFNGCLWLVPFFDPAPEKKGPLFEPPSNEYPLCDPPPAIFTEVPYIPTYPWPRCLYMTVLKIANDFFVCGMLCRRKITGWYFPSFPDVFIIYRFFWGAGRFSICWLSLFSLDIFFFQNCWLRYGLKRPLLLSTEKCSEIIVLHLLSPRPSF